MIAETGRTEQRSRLLPARVVVYFVLAMCLFFGQGYEEVARLLGEGLGDGRRTWRVPTTAAIGRARRRLGTEPLRALFARVRRPVAVPETAGAWYRRWRLVAVDGTTLDVADTAANEEFFGPHASTRGAAAFSAGTAGRAGGMRHPIWVFCWIVRWVRHFSVSASAERAETSGPACFPP
ncbi:transposase domain-containing protein [Streptomyces mutabilis]|uniref:transposase domain-containing protein n=1 Tax=Streptomyces mutabilis TaxID=67332 RepID=UPI00406BD751